MIDTYSSLYLILLNFTTISALCPDYFNEVYCPVDNNGVATRSSNKKLKLPFRKSKLGTQSFSYREPSTWNKLPNNFKTATNVNCFKHYIKKYFLKKLSETEADIYSYD